MRKEWRWIAAALTVSVAVIWLFFSRTSLADRPVVLNGTAVAPVPTLNPAQVTSGQSLYAQNCAGCHGANLQGVPDWKKPLPDGSFPPPPQDSSGHTWHHPDALILSIIANGGNPAYNSKMPAFKDKLTSDEMAAILDYIKSKWGKTSASSNGGSRRPEIALNLSVRDRMMNCMDTRHFE